MSLEDFLFDVDEQLRDLLYNLSVEMELNEILLVKDQVREIESASHWFLADTYALWRGVRR